MSTVSILEQVKCTGCGSCANKCPKDAITMQQNAEGFLYPVVNDNCIDCGLCVKSCPAIEYNFKNPIKPKCYAVWAEKEIREVSSSGGLFSVLANRVLKHKGIVVGAAWDKDFGVQHIIVDSKKDLYKLRSSKYVQSVIDDTLFNEIKDYVQSGKEVLFSGCPCQVAGLQKFLGQEYDNILYVDIVCHGVPSPKVLKAYLNEVRGDKNIKSVDFRDKKYFGWQTITAIKFDDNSEYIRNYWDSTWHKAYAQGLHVRECCGGCKYAKTQRVGDITIGDFWQIHRFKPEYNDWRGTGLALINTEKGDRAFNAIKNKLVLAEEMPLENAAQYNGQLRAPIKLSESRKVFFDTFEKTSVIDATAKAINSYDIGVMGFWYSNNYGSILTYYVLREILQRLGKSVLMIDKPLVNGSLDGEHNNNSPARIFANEHNYNISEPYAFGEMNKLNSLCNTFIAGSDQLWNYGIAKAFRGTLFLDFVHDEKKRIAYSTSFGHNGFWAPSHYEKMAAYFVSKFDNIAVREESAIDLCRKHFHSEAALVLDPLLIAKKSDYDNLISESNPTYKGEFFLSYILDPNEEKTKAIKALRKHFGCTSVNIVDGLPQNFQSNVDKMNLDNTLSGVRVQEWLYYYKNAKFVITDSFHGTCLALFFNKQFISIVNDWRGATRFETLKNIFGLDDQIVTNTKNIISIVKNNQINYNNVNEILNERKEFSLNWLANAVNMPKNTYKNLPNEIRSRLYTTNEYIWSLKKMINEKDADYKRIIIELEKKISDLQGQKE